MSHTPTLVGMQGTLAPPPCPQGPGVAAVAIPQADENCQRRQGTPVAVMIREANPRRGQDQGSLEVLCPDRALGKELLTELGQLSLRHSVLRGQLISLKESGYEQTARGVTFLPRPQVSAEDVILPAGRLDHVKEHVLGIASHAQQLRAAGQHLKRGVLLYGPPGTGKTHTLRHLLTEATDHTVVVLSGQSLAYVSMAAKIARALQPSIVVLEDVDLVAGERDFSAGAQPLLFEVMDAMDGLDGDADVTFLLTTNRVEAMEDALTQRPGRVDLAVEVPLPDLAGRIQLLQLYAPADAFSHAEIERTAARLEGTTASLAKELVRRCVLMATIEGSQRATTSCDAPPSRCSTTPRNCPGCCWALVGQSPRKRPAGVPGSSRPADRWPAGLRRNRRDRRPHRRWPGAG